MHSCLAEGNTKIRLNQAILRGEFGRFQEFGYGIVPLFFLAQFHCVLIVGFCFLIRSNHWAAKKQDQAENQKTEAIFGFNSFHSGNMIVEF